MKHPRLDQLLSNLGYCSRSEARRWLGQGRVTLNDESVRDPAKRLDPLCLHLDGEPLDHPLGMVLAFHKPLGYVVSHRESGPTIYRFFPELWLRRNPVLSSVGRLDKDTSGLLILTDYGDLIHRLTSPKQKIPKVYELTLASDLRGDEGQRLAAGDLVLEGEETPCLPAELDILDARHARITVYEGRYHLVRRMFVALGNQVTHLHRIRIGQLALGDLPPGEYRDLDADDLARALNEKEMQ